MGALKLEIKDFGPINEAELNIGKINIISGINGSGKSTTSKILYSFLASISQEGINFQNIVASKYLGDIERFIRFSADDYSEDLRKKFRNIRNSTSTTDFLDNKDIKNVLLDLKGKEYIKSSKNFEKSIEEFEKIYKLRDNLEKRGTLIFRDLILNEFNNDIHSSIDSNLSLVNEKGSFMINFPLTDNNLRYQKMSFFVNDVFYIETPFIFDFISNARRTTYGNNILYHQNSLIERLSGLKTEDKLPVSNLYSESNNQVIEIINEIMQGMIKYNIKERKFSYKKFNDEHDIKNTAAGIKMIGILQLLLNNGLDTNSFIIMDEPEVHLHPSWQIKLAEVIVLLSKYEDINFYINSHSPQFIDSVEVFSEKYGLEDETNFYITQKAESSDKFDFIEIDRQNINVLYNDLSNSFEIIDKIRGQNLAKKF
ncbi:MAG: ATP-binding protein [Methanobrevibacter sp.]|jgi:predicted ATPase|nr:ATP-binding protein [Candidatus Methanovirga aequatorialis]